MTRSIHRLAAEDLRAAARRYRLEAGAGLVYRHEDGDIRILVVRHQSRGPDYGESRR